MDARASAGSLDRLWIRAMVLVLAAALSGLAGCGPRDAPPWNVVLVVVDTLRADRLSLYGYHRPTSPQLEDLARRAVVFENVQSQAGCTFPSVNSLLTSLYPYHFLRQGEGRDLSIPEGIASLPEILGRAGRATLAVSASPIVRATPSRNNPQGGYGRGFERFDEECLSQDAACVNRRFLDLLATTPEPFFAYLHYLDPHAPYHPPRDHPRRFADRGYQGSRWVRWGNVRPITDALYRGGGKVGFGPEDIEHLRDLYDEEVRYFDRRFGELIRWLDARGLMDRTLLILAADHGEELMEHGEFTHCRDIAYETNLRTPLLMAIPGVPGGVRRRALVQNLDLVPTVLDYLGIAADGLALEGRSLRPVIAADRPVHRQVFGLQGTARTVRDGRHKLLYHLGDGSARLYDLGEDPGETRDLAARRPEVRARLETALFAWIEALEGAVGAETSLERARRNEELLRALGYL